jgi:hypothetical protein
MNRYPGRNTCIREPLVILYNTIWIALLPLFQTQAEVWSEQFKDDDFPGSEQAR